MKVIKLISCVIALIINLAVNAQAISDTSGMAGPHHFLWFTGHWDPSKKNVFFIDKDSTFKDAGSVILTPEGKVQIQSQGQDEWNKRVDEALQKVEDWENQLNAPADNIDLTTHHLNEAQLPEANDSKKEWKGYKIDSKQDILNSDNNNDNKLANIATSNCERYKPMYNEIIQYYEAHRRDKDADLQNPVPPQFDYTCFACDSQARKDHDTIVQHFVRSFPHPEDKYIREGITILHELALMGTGPEDGVSEYLAPYFHLDKKDPSKSGPCSYLDLYKLNQAVFSIAGHYYRRAERLLHDNRKNYKAAWAVESAYISAARDWTLLTGNDNFDSHTGELISLVQQNYEYYYDKLKHNDWTQIGNIPFLISLLRQAGLLGAGYSAEDDFFAKLKEIYNNFRLSVELDVKSGSNGGYLISHIKGDCYIIPDFKNDSNQCYHWVIADDDARDVIGFRKTKPSQQIDCQLVTNEILTPQPPRPVYIGSKHYTTDLKMFHMDFCKQGKDSILLTGFSPNPTENGLWQFPYNITQNLGINQADQYFKDINAMKKMAQSGKAKEEAGNMKTQADQLRTQMEDLSQKMKASDDKLAYYQQIMELSQKMRNLSDNINVAQLVYIDFELPVTNNSPILVNKKYEAQQINPQLSKTIVYGYYTVHIENKANGSK